jgi:hypothetical protein
MEAGRLPIEVRYANGELIGPRRTRLRDDQEVRLWNVWTGELPLPDVEPGDEPGESIVRLRRGECQCDVYVIGTLGDQQAAARASQQAARLGGPLPPDFKLPNRAAR